MSIFILSSGLGFGNATRELAIIDSLIAKAPSLDIHIYTWGRGYLFFKQTRLSSNIRLHELINFQLRSSQSYFLQFLFNFIVYILCFPLNTIYLFFQRIKYKPKVCIFDSDYHCLAFFFGELKRFAINQAPYIVQKGKGIPISFVLKNHFVGSFLIEHLDYWLNLFLMHKVLCPSFSSLNITHSKIISLAPIVRSAFLQNFKLENKGLACLESGSGIDSEKLLKVMSGKSITHLRCCDNHPSNTAELLKYYNPVYTQGGMSALSELVALKKKIIVIPIKGHWEQFINTQELVSLNLATSLDSFKSRFPKDTSAVLSKSILKCDGADKASEIILNYYYE